MNEETLEAQETESTQEVQEQGVDEPTQPAEQDGEQEGLPISLTPEEVVINYPGFKTPQTEAEIHYELSSIDVVIKSLETRRAKLQRDWTHYKLTVHLNQQAAAQQAVSESSGE